MPARDGGHFFAGDSHYGSAEARSERGVWCLKDEHESFEKFR